MKKLVAVAIAVTMMTSSMMNAMAVTQETVDTASTSYYTVVRPDETAIWFDAPLEGNLKLQTQSGELWGQTNSTRNLVLYTTPDAVSNIDVIVKVSGRLATGANKETVGMILYKDDDNYVTVQNNENLAGVITVNEKNGIPSEAAGNNTLKRGTMYYRIVKSGDVVRTYYSLDQRAWKNVASVTNATLKEGYKIGFFASGEGASGSNFVFSEFQVNGQSVDIEQPQSDKTELGRLITSVEGLSETDYTAESWADMLEMLSPAKTVYENENAWQSEVNKAYDDLLAARNALVLASQYEGYQVILNENSGISGKAGTTFKLTVDLSDFPIEMGARSIEGVMNLPADVKLKSIAKADNVTADSFDYNEADGVLRFAYLNHMDADAISYTGNGVSELFTAEFELTKDKMAGDSLSFVFDRFSVKSADEALEFGVEFGDTVVPVLTDGEKKTAVAAEMYVGSGIDIIGENQKVVAVSFIGVDENSLVRFGQTDLYYSAEKSAKTGKPTFMAVVDTKVSLEEMSVFENYTIQPAEKILSVKFGDVDNSGGIDAQDALNTMRVWLRKDLEMTDQKMIAMNVTADAVIDTGDAVAIVDYFANGTPFAILTK